MSELEILALKALAGGLGVLAFALVAEVLKPKRFSGLFAAAPSVAIASLLVTASKSGIEAAGQSAVGMIAGAVGMLGFCVVAAQLIPRLGALKASLVSTPVWAVLAVGVYVGFLR